MAGYPTALPGASSSAAQAAPLGGGWAQDHLFAFENLFGGCAEENLESLARALRRFYTQHGDSETLEAVETAFANRKRTVRGARRGEKRAREGEEQSLLQGALRKRSPESLPQRSLSTSRAEEPQNVIHLCSNCDDEFMRLVALAAISSEEESDDVNFLQKFAAFTAPSAGGCRCSNGGKNE